MKGLYESYRQTIDELAVYISRLKNEKLNCHDPEELNSLNARIELLETERWELMRTSAQLRAHFDPKPASPSISARMTEVGAL